MTQPVAPYSQPVQIVGPDGTQSEGVNKVAVYFWDNVALEWTKATTGSPVANNVNVMNFPSTYPMTAAALPLPAGAATEATLSTLNANAATEATLATLLKEATLTARLGTLGQTTMAGSTPVVIASNQSTLNSSVTLADGLQLDAFNRLRVSSPVTLFDEKQINDNSHLVFTTVTAGAGTAPWSYDRASTALTVTNASGDRAVRQSRTYFTYIPGRSQVIILTAILGTAKANCNQYVGYGDDLNGLFFTMQGTSFGVLTRTSTSGAAVNTFVPQSSFNIDHLDGTGPSGHTIDLTKAQIFFIDFQWLGVGRVRFGVVKNGVAIAAHQMLNTNNTSVVYMRTPSLPVRYEIINAAGTSGSTVLESICSSVSTEGIGTPNGYDFAAGNGIAARAITTRQPLFAIRMKNEYPAGKPNRRFAKFVNLNVTCATNDALIELMHVHDPSAITATWVSADDESAVEYSANITAVTGNPMHRVQSFTVTAGQGSISSSTDVSGQFISLHSTITQNFDSTNSEMFLVMATAHTGTANVEAQMNWVEIQ